MRDATTGRCFYHRETGERPRVGAGAPVPEPPASLSEQATGVWRALTAAWVLGADELLVLEGGLRSWDLYTEARGQLTRDGAVIVTDSGSKRHPAALVARDAFADYRAALRQLGLETEG